MSGIINSIKEKIAEVKGDHNTAGSTNAGPHSSNVANKADPRVDSDLDGGRHAGLNQTTGTGLHSTSGIGSSGANTTVGVDHGTGTGLHSTSGIGSSGANTTVGPHGSDTLNKLDPRVDSDLSGGHPGANTAYTASGAQGTTGSTVGSTGAYGSTNAGPHSSNMANAVDPRVDSDLDGSRNAGLNQTTGHHAHHHGSHHTGTGVTGSTSNTTAGPHSSSLLNKLDPRVHTESSGSHTGSHIHNSTTGDTSNIPRNPNEPLDAAKHSPTVFREVHGDPAVHHNFPEDAAHARHGSVSKSDQHYGSGAY